MGRNNNELLSNFNYHFSLNNKTTYDIVHKFFKWGSIKSEHQINLIWCSSELNWTE